jgi:hypothetical protein
MKINDIFVGSLSIFEGIFKKDFPELYKNIFGDIDPVLIDLQVRHKYGEKNLLNTISIDNAEDTVKGIIAMNFDSWAKQIQVFNLDYDVLNPVTSKETVSETSNVDETGNNTNVDSTTAFNDGELNNDSKQQRDTTGNRQETTEKTTVKSGISSSVPVSEVIQKEMTLRKQNLKDEVIKQILDSITIDIY